MMFKKKSGFPVGAEIDSVHLTRMNFHTFSKEHSQENVGFHFRRGTKKLRDCVYFPDESRFDDHQSFMYKMAACKTILERIGVTYLGKEAMAKINREAEGLDDYFEAMYTQMIDMKFWEQEIVIKTGRDKKGFIRVALWSDFIKKADEDRKLQYTDYEKNNVEKHEKRKKALGESNEPF